MPKAAAAENEYGVMVEERFCERNGDPYCEFHIKWESNGRYSMDKIHPAKPQSFFYFGVHSLKTLVKTGFKKALFSFPQVKKLLAIITKLELVISNQTKDLQNANISLEEKVRERTIELERYKNKLSSLTSELLIVEEGERYKLSTVLHDQIGQMLAMSRIKISEIRGLGLPEKIEEDLCYVNQLLKDSIKDVRSMIFDLSPPILYELGLIPTIEWMVDEFQNRHHIQIYFNSEGDIEVCDATIKVFLYRAVRELLVNIIKHAEAKSVEITMMHGSGCIRVAITDDGIGFDASSMKLASNPSKHFGLFSLKDRFENLGGNFSIQSRHNRGTRIELKAPDKVPEVKRTSSYENKHHYRG